MNEGDAFSINSGFRSETNVKRPDGESQPAEPDEGFTSTGTRFSGSTPGVQAVSGAEAAILKARVVSKQNQERRSLRKMGGASSRNQERSGATTRSNVREPPAADSPPGRRVIEENDNRLPSKGSMVRRNEPESPSQSRSSSRNLRNHLAADSTDYVRGTAMVLDQTTEEPHYRDGMDMNPYRNDDAYGKHPLKEKGPTTEESAAHGKSTERDLVYGTSGNQYDHGYNHKGLAIAMAVEDDGDDAFIPAAIQYDPDAKPPLYKNRRVRLYVVMAGVLLFVIVIAAAVGATSGGAMQLPTTAPSSVRESLGIQEQITDIVGEKVLSDPTTPQSLAMEWIINEDPAMLPSHAENLIQRYLLAYFYISTTKYTQWLSCNQPKEGEDSSCIYKKLLSTTPNETYQEFEWVRWLSIEHECAWAGVYCDEFNQTRAIELTGQEIRGTLPTDITKMPYLQSFTLNWNEFFGTLPPEMAKMKHLLNIEFHYNFFSGEIPPEWYSSQNLQRLNLAGNMLTGRVPTEIGQLTSMKGFFLFENTINGTIPSEIGNMKNLAFARWGRNMIRGTLPTELGKLSKLQELWLARNLLTGSIPSQFGNLVSIGDIRISNNPITGIIPDDFYRMPKLDRFDAYDCSITGTISTLIGEMSNLAVFLVRGNSIDGTIPIELGNIDGLKSVWVHLNDIRGTMPAEVCALRGESGLIILNADCRSDDSTAPLVSCETGCCTSCCDTNSGVCLST